METTNSTYPNGIRIDLDEPYINIGPKGTFKNMSTDSYSDNLPSDENEWTYTDSINFTWSGTDDTSSVAAYSYSLSKNPNIRPDTIPEGTQGNLQFKTHNLFSNLESGKYFFKVRTEDEAGNWGGYKDINFSIDITEPTRPTILEKIKGENNLTVTWSQAYDDESNVVRYMVNLTEDGNPYRSEPFGSSTFEYTFDSVPSGTYNATVGAKNGVGLWRWSDQKTSDTVPPVITVRPNSTNVYSVSDTPKIKVWSNEKCVCYYNASTRNVRFKFTNTTYHETKVYPSGDRASYDITCIDLAGNIRIGKISFVKNTSKVPSIIKKENTISAHENTLVRFSLNVTENTNLLTDVYINVLIDGEEQNASVFDEGTGIYNISFMSPKDSGSYVLRIYNPQNYTDINMNVKDVSLTASYKDAISNEEQSDHILVYKQGNRKRGLATTDDNAMLGSDSNKINISIDEGESILIINTNIKNIDAMEKRFEEDILNDINPALGYALSESYILKFSLGYDDHTIRTDSYPTLGSGKHNFNIHKIIEDDTSTIKFIRSDEQHERIVIKGD